MKKWNLIIIFGMVMLMSEVQAFISVHEDFSGADLNYTNWGNLTPASNSPTVVESANGFHHVRADTGYVSGTYYQLGFNLTNITDYNYALFNITMNSTFQNGNCAPFQRVAQNRFSLTLCENDVTCTQILKQYNDTVFSDYANFTFFVEMGKSNVQINSSECLTDFCSSGPDSLTVSFDNSTYGRLFFAMQNNMGSCSNGNSVVDSFETFYDTFYYEAWNSYPVINAYGTEPVNPVLNDNVTIWINTTDPTGIYSCVFDAKDPNGLVVLDNENASSNDDGVWNSSSFEANQSGLYWYNATCYNSENLTALTSNGFSTADTTPPEIILTDPNDTYTSKSNIPLNWSVIDATGLRTCSYTLDGGFSNTTISCSQNTTFPVGGNGEYTLEFYGEDYGSNLGITNSTFVVNEPGGATPPGGGGGGETVKPKLLKNLGEQCAEDNDCASGICYPFLNETDNTCKASLCGNNICDFVNGENINECFIDCGIKSPMYKTVLSVVIPILLISAVIFTFEKKKTKGGRKIWRRKQSQQ